MAVFVPAPVVQWSAAPAQAPAPVASRLAQPPNYARPSLATSFSAAVATGFGGGLTIALAAKARKCRQRGVRGSASTFQGSLTQRKAGDTIDHLLEGATVPSVTFKTRTRTTEAVENPFDWKDIASEDLFKGKRVVLFALPGAFTPTCSTSHLPGYEAKYEEFKSLGIDEVYCLSVNDAFVMRQWGLSQGLEEDNTPGSLGFKKVKLLPDGACLFTRGMGMSCVWTTERGFGERTWRYSAVINDMKIEKLYVEGPKVQNSGPDPFEVTDSDTMLDYLKQHVLVAA